MEYNLIQRGSEKGVRKDEHGLPHICHSIVFHHDPLLMGDVTDEFG